MQFAERQSENFEESHLDESCCTWNANIEGFDDQKGSRYKFSDVWKRWCTNSEQKEDIWGSAEAMNSEESYSATISNKIL